MYIHVYIYYIYIHRCFKYCTSRESCFQNVQKEKYAEKIYNIVYCFIWLEPQISFGKQGNRQVWEEQHRISIDKCVWTGLCLLMITVRYLQNQWSQRSQIQYQIAEDLRWEWERKVSSTIYVRSKKLRNFAIPLNIRFKQRYWKNIWTKKMFGIRWPKNGLAEKAVI